MDRIEKRLKWTDEDFKLRVGTTKPVFHEMLATLQAAYIRIRPGKKSKNGRRARAAWR